MILLKLAEFWSTSVQDGTAVQAVYYLGCAFQLSWTNTQGLVPTLCICVCIPTSNTNDSHIVVMKFR